MNTFEIMDSRELRFPTSRAMHKKNPSCRRQAVGNPWAAQTLREKEGNKGKEVLVTLLSRRFGNLNWFWPHPFCSHRVNFQLFLVSGGVDVDTTGFLLTGHLGNYSHRRKHENS